MRVAVCSPLLVAVLPGACASPDNLAGQRTVFSNPYAAPTIDRTGIGPNCEAQFGRDATCLGEVVATSRRGRIARLSNGETIRLTRNQARILREQAARAAVPERQSPPPPPVPTTADDAAETP
jgi:hypothetical protein